MKKSEIKNGVKNIINAIKNFREQLDDLYKPIEEIKKHLEDIQQIQEDNGLNCEIDFEDVERDLVISLIENNDDYQEIDSAFDGIISDLECWLDDGVSEKKQELIQEDYITPLEDVRNNIDLSEVLDKDSLDDMLIGILNDIEELEFI